mmetsp:Transcript_20058/g.63858  ORF Transcript_20058/g.63858 Transcript_20058/m.63858 type:complete len:215 (+) Transcript_20058:290-934(+)
MPTPSAWTICWACRWGTSRRSKRGSSRPSWTTVSVWSVSSSRTRPTRTSSPWPPNSSGTAHRRRTRPSSRSFAPSPPWGADCGTATTPGQRTSSASRASLPQPRRRISTRCSTSSTPQTPRAASTSTPPRTRPPSSPRSTRTRWRAWRGCSRGSSRRASRPSGSSGRSSASKCSGTPSPPPPTRSGPRQCSAASSQMTWASARPSRASPSRGPC